MMSNKNIILSDPLLDYRIGFRDIDGYKTIEELKFYNDPDELHDGVVFESMPKADQTDMLVLAYWYREKQRLAPLPYPLPVEISFERAKYLCRMAFGIFAYQHWNAKRKAQFEDFEKAFVALKDENKTLKAQVFVLEDQNNKYLHMIEQYADEIQDDLARMVSQAEKVSSEKGGSHE